MARFRDLNIREVCLFNVMFRQDEYIHSSPQITFSHDLTVFFFWGGKNYTEVSGCVFSFFIRKVPNINRSDSLSRLFERTFGCRYFCKEI